MDASTLRYMNWWRYFTAHKGEDNQATVAERLGVQQSTISRWKTAPPSAANAAAFAREYGRPVLEAFIAAGFLTAEEAGEHPAATPSLTDMTDDELLEEVRRRMAQGGQQ